jgi:hypothetical protein
MECASSGRTLRAFHVLNRAVGRMRLFRTDNDFEAFRRVMIEALERHPHRIVALETTRPLHRG